MDGDAGLMSGLGLVGVVFLAVRWAVGSFIWALNEFNK
jgi:hypothetical protein